MLEPSFRSGLMTGVTAAMLFATSAAWAETEGQPLAAQIAAQGDRALLQIREEVRTAALARMEAMLPRREAVELAALQAAPTGGTSATVRCSH